MASFAPRPDGLFNVTLDNGMVLPMPLSEEQLRGAGASPAGAPPSLYADAGAPPMPGPDMRTADLGAGLGGPPNAGLVQSMNAQDTAASAPAPPGAGIHGLPMQPGSAPSNFDRFASVPNPGASRELVRPRPPMPQGSAQSAPGEQGRPPDPLVEQVVAQSLRGSGPGAYVPERDVRASYQMKLGKPLPPGQLEREQRLGTEADQAMLEGTQGVLDARALERQEMQKRALEE